MMSPGLQLMKKAMLRPGPEHSFTAPRNLFATCTQFAVLDHHVIYCQYSATKCVRNLLTPDYSLGKDSKKVLTAAAEKNATRNSPEQAWSLPSCKRWRSP
uniref:Uncharacterized protein n=1 Tax=Arundo donax TaxID=35708 RepID=A0A0A9E0D0_ARUDO